MSAHARTHFSCGPLHAPRGASNARCTEAATSLKLMIIHFSSSRRILDVTVMGDNSLVAAGYSTGTQPTLVRVPRSGAGETAFAKRVQAAAVGPL